MLGRLDDQIARSPEQAILYLKRAELRIMMLRMNPDYLDDKKRANMMAQSVADLETGLKMGFHPGLVAMRLGQLHLTIGRFLENQGAEPEEIQANYDQAYRVMQRALELVGERGFFADSLRLGLAEALIQQKKYRECLDAISEHRIDSMSMRKGEAYFFRAYALKRSGKDSEADKALELARKLHLNIDKMRASKSPLFDDFAVQTDSKSRPDTASRISQPQKFSPGPQDIGERLINMVTILPPLVTPIVSTPETSKKENHKELEPDPNPQTKEDYLKIIARAKEALRKNPQDAFAYIDMGFGYGNLGDPKKDLECCNKAIEIDAGIPVAFAERAKAFTMLDLDAQALSDLNRAIELDPNNSAFYARRAWIYGKQGRYKQAIEECNRSIEIYSGYSPAFYCRGRAFIRIKRYEAAVRDLTTAISLYPEKISGYYQERAYAYERLNRTDKAMEDLRMSVKVDPADFISHVFLGKLLIDGGKLAEGIASLDRALVLNPKCARALSARGNAYAQLGDFRRAMVDLNGACLIEPKESEAFSLRARTYSMQGDHKKAIDDFRIADKLDPGNVYILLKLASAFLANKQYKESIEYFDKVIKLDPLVAEAFSSRGRAYGELGELKKERQDCYNAIAADPLKRSVYMELHKRALQ